MELDTTLRRCQLDRARAFGDRNRRIEHLEDALEADECGEDLETRIRQTRQWLIDALHERRHRHERADGDSTIDDHEGADAVDRHGTESADETEGDEEHPSVHRRLHADVTHAHRARRERSDLLGSPTEQLDEECSRDVEALGHLRVHLGVQAHLLAGDVLQSHTDATGRDDERGQHDQRQHRESPLEGDHCHERRREHDHVRHHAAERPGHRGLSTDDIVVQAADQRTGLRAGEERDRHALHLGKERHAQVVDQTLTDQRRQPTLHDLQPGLGQREHDEHDRQHDDRRAIGVRNRHVDDPAKQQWWGECHKCRNEDRGEEERDPRAIRASKAGDPTQRRSADRRTLHRALITRNEVVGTHAHAVRLRAPFSARATRRLD